MIPAVANFALAVLWAFTALGGWGEQAFCGVDDAPDPACTDGVGSAVLVSLVAVVPGAGMILAAVVLHTLRRDENRLTGMLTVAAILWVVAEGIVFLGGHLAQMD
ncbi:hypothetical protein ACN3XK_10145 [Actinomadura welshii]